MLIVPAPAKINLALEVVRRRDDGWHDIESVIVPIDWHDLVGVGPPSARTTVRVTGPAAIGVPADAANLAARAVDLAFAFAGEEGGAGVWVHKSVPAAAGLGGGSADAAAALIAAERVLQARGAALAEPQLDEIAARLGSDVPAMRARRAVHASGRGEQLAPTTVAQLFLVIAFLGAASTQAAYQATRPDEWSDGARVRNLVAAIESGQSPPDELLGSALEAPALRVNSPLADAAERLRGLAPSQAWHLTGSGGAYFTVMSGARQAHELADRLRATGVTARATTTIDLPAGAR